MRRPAATLLELLVALSIVWLLTALSLPAIQNVRQAADRLACRSKLRQIALAAHHYEESHGQLPPAFNRNRLSEPMPSLQWSIRLAPYLEQDAVWREASEDFQRTRRSYHSPPQHRGMNRPISALICPVDTRLDRFKVVPVAERGGGKIYKPEVAVMSYQGVSGTRSQLADGVMIVDGKIAMVQIADGTSNTLFFGERPPPMNFAYGWVYAGVGQDGYGSMDSVLGVREANFTVNKVAPANYRLDYGLKNCGPGPLAYAPPGDDRKCNVFQFWSMHPGGSNFAFADGSVRFIHYGADAVLPALSTRGGGEVVNLD